MSVRERATLSFDLDDLAEQLGAWDLDDLTTLLFNLADSLPGKVGEQDREDLLAERVVWRFGSLLCAAIEVSGYQVDADTRGVIENLERMTRP